MRSYYAHLETIAAPKQGAVSPRPTFRSSAIFPVMQRNGITSRLLFMGYWILKRNIHEIAAVINLRNPEGTLLTRRVMYIREAKTFRIELSDELEQAGIDRFSDFDGSMEIEFFSTQNLVFPFPAVVINYYGPRFSTVVHTAQRIYNDFDDMKKNSQTDVPESGFNIYADDDTEPFIGLINGSVPVDSSHLKMQFFNDNQETLDCHIDLGRMEPYEMRMIYPAQSANLRQFLHGRLGTARISFNVNWIFPRLLVGNLHRSIPALTITHTYYDCSKASLDSDYWRAEEPGWHGAALMLPLEIVGSHFTNIYFYPIYSPSTFAIDVEIYNEKGSLLGSKREALTIEAPLAKFYHIPLKALCKEFGIDDHQNYAARLIARPHPGNRLPARIKLGLDVGSGNRETSCNICTNLQPFNPSLENKPTSFRWSPILADQPKASVWIMNSSPAVDYQRNADVTLTFFHESDDQTLTRTLQIPPHGFKVLSIAEDEELTRFFNGQVGWMTSVTSNPYTTTYYFAESSAGVVGGDHGF